MPLVTLKEETVGGAGARTVKPPVAETEPLALEIATFLGPGVAVGSITSVADIILSESTLTLSALTPVPEKIIVVGATKLVPKMLKKLLVVPGMPLLGLITVIVGVPAACITVIGTAVSIRL